MFTGIIQVKGRIAQKRYSGVDAQLYIQTNTLDINTITVGDSIAVNGVCLTAITLTKEGFWADVSEETLSHSTLGNLSVHSEVNLETALTLQTPLGGHLVSGHVDGIGIVTQCYSNGRSTRLQIQAPANLAKYIASKGSITVDGISLTVNTVEGNEFSLNIVPHTLAVTTLNQIKVGQGVNLEVDIIARYLERLLLSKKTSQPYATEKINLEFLHQHGFF